MDSTNPQPFSTLLERAPAAGKGSGWWLSALGVIFALVVMLFPGHFAPNVPLLVRMLAIALSVVALKLLVSGCDRFCRLRRQLQKGLAYDQLNQQWEAERANVLKLEGELTKLRDLLRQYLIGKKS